MYHTWNSPRSCFRQSSGFSSRPPTPEVSMSELGAPQHPIAIVEVDGRRFTVSLRTAYDGIEHVGRLWFSEEGGASPPIPDHGAISGATAEEAVEMARRFSADDLA